MCDVCGVDAEYVRLFVCLPVRLQSNSALARIAPATAAAAAAAVGAAAAGRQRSCGSVAVGKKFGLVWTVWGVSKVFGYCLGIFLDVVRHLELSLFEELSLQSIH